MVLALILLKKLVQLAQTTRNLVGHGLDEGASTRLLNYAATLIKGGIEAKQACQMTLVNPITDDKDILATMQKNIEMVFA